jgi:hypothetical protein
MSSLTRVDVAIENGAKFDMAKSVTRAADIANRADQAAHAERTAYPSREADKISLRRIQVAQVAPPIDALLQRRGSRSRLLCDFERSSAPFFPCRLALGRLRRIVAIGRQPITPRRLGDANSAFSTQGRQSERPPMGLVPILQSG